ITAVVSFFFFFFQAEDGIRDGHVTGVQTCALPILPAPVQTVPPHPLLMYCTLVVLRFTQTDVLFRIASCRAPFRMVWSSWAPAEIGRASCREKCRSRWSW